MRGRLYSRYEQSHPVNLTEFNHTEIFIFQTQISSDYHIHNCSVYSLPLLTAHRTQAVAEYNSIRRKADRKTMSEWCEHMKRIWIQNQTGSVEKYTPDVMMSEDDESSQEDYDSYTDESGDSYDCPF